jgi:transcriptional regulator with XRE-family HTH domain
VAGANQRRFAATPHPVDVYVGWRIRIRRLLLGMSQKRLAEGLGVSYQQVQKYEKGTNRITSSGIKKGAEILGVSIDYLFPARGSDLIELTGEEEQLRTMLQKPGAADLLRFYWSIPKPVVRAQFLDLVKSVPARC